VSHTCSNDLSRYNDNRRSTATIRFMTVRWGRRNGGGRRNKVRWGRRNKVHDSSVGEEVHDSSVGEEEQGNRQFDVYGSTVNSRLKFIVSTDAVISESELSPVKHTMIFPLPQPRTTTDLISLCSAVRT
jgi:hypothetical protein